MGRAEQADLFARERHEQHRRFHCFLLLRGEPRQFHHAGRAGGVVVGAVMDLSDLRRRQRIRARQGPDDRNARRRRPTRLFSTGSEPMKRADHIAHRLSVAHDFGRDARLRSRADRTIAAAGPLSICFWIAGEIFARAAGRPAQTGRVWHGSRECPCRCTRSAASRADLFVRDAYCGSLRKTMPFAPCSRALIALATKGACRRVIRSVEFALRVPVPAARGATRRRSCLSRRCRRNRRNGSPARRCRSRRTHTAFELGGVGEDNRHEIFVDFESRPVADKLVLRAELSPGRHLEKLKIGAVFPGRPQSGAETGAM